MPVGRVVLPGHTGDSLWKKAATAIVYQETIGGVAYTIAVSGYTSQVIANQAAALGTDQIILNAATVYVAALGGGEIYVEGAGYNLAATWNVAVYISVRGAGWAAILNYNAGGNCITFTGNNAKVKDLKIVIVAGAGGVGTRPNGIIADTRTNLEVSGVWVVGDQTVTSDASDVRQCGILLDTVTESVIQDNVFEEHKRHGMSVINSTCNKFTNNTSKLNTQYGFNAATSTENIISGNNLFTNLVHGILLATDCNDNIITGNHCEGNGGIGLYLVTTCNNNTLTGNHVEGSTLSGINVGGGCINVTITGNTCIGNTHHGISVTGGDDCTVVGNTCNDNLNNGIRVTSHQSSTISGNTCKGNTDHGLSLEASHNNTITGNTCSQNIKHGVLIDDSNDNTVAGNSCNGNDSGDTNTYSGITVTDISLDNTIRSNTCNDNDAYGIDIDDANSARNWVKNNQLRGNGTRGFNDAGTDTKLATLRKQFVQGTTFISADGSAKGWEINAEADFAVALEQLPLEVQQVVRVKIWAVALGAPAGGGGQMHLDIVIQAGADDLAYTTENISLANFDSVTTDYVNTDVVHWSVDSGDDANIDTLVGGMSLECKVNGGTAVAPDGATNATFRVMEIEVV